jgi:glucose/arabinose dehydrogenase
MITALLVGVLAQGAAPPAKVSEADYYTVDYLVPPEGATVEVGGMDWLPDGRLAVSTRRGQVWLVENALAKDPHDARFHLYAEGLQEGLGLAVVDGELYVLQRSELSRLKDTDSDGAVDRIETVSRDWGNSGHYHEFAFGLPRDRQGNFYISLNVSFGDPQWWLGRSTVPYRGWAMKIAPDGTTTPFACGFRSPCGLGVNAEGDLFLTENQGDWMPCCPIFHLREGLFYGHPTSLRWTDEYQEAKRIPSDTTPPERERAQAAVWIPYDWSRSAGALVPDLTGGRFGPFEKDLFVAEMTNGYVLRAQLEKVRDEYQGAVFPFRREVGSAVRVLFAPDGTLFAGFTERGWGGQAPGSGIGRLRWTGEKPMEIQRVHLLQDGFELGFTLPLAGELKPDQIRLQRYDYDWWWEYGSPVRHLADLRVERVERSSDPSTVRIHCSGLQPGFVVRAKLSGVTGQGAVPLLHDEFAYTVNQLPEGPLSTKNVANRVPPPPPRESSSEGVVLLQRGAPEALWQGSGWSDAKVRLDPKDPTRLAVEEPEPVGDDAPPPDRGRTYSNLGSANAGDLTSRLEFGDVDLSLSFLLPRGAHAKLWLMGRYGIALGDEGGALTAAHCGGLEPGASGVFPGKAPDFDAYRGAGEWHELSARFQAARFDEQGRKTANARLYRLLMDDVLLQDEIELPEPSAGAPLPGEAARGPIVIRSVTGEIAFRDLQARERTPASDAQAQGWTPILDDLAAWTQTGDATWELADGVLKGTGPAGHLFSPRGDYRDFELRARVRISDKGNSGMYVRAELGEGWPAGYEAQVNSTHPDTQRTGSLYGLAPLEAELVPPDIWFEQIVTVRDEPEGTRLTIRVNGVVVTDYLDTQRLHASGHVALQQHNDGSVVEYRDVAVRELR